VSPDMRVLDPLALAAAAAEHPYPLLFATVSGAHLYGFPSRDSDVDLRGVHMLPLRELVGLRTGPETVERSWVRDGAEYDLVTHDTAKFLRLLLRRNGYVLEQLLSPLVVVGGPGHDELVALAPGCLTRHHAHHYRGFARNSQALYEKTGELKPLLYAFRVLLTGLHLVSTGNLVADLRELAGLPQAPPYLGELMAAKAAHEHVTAPDGTLPPPDRLAADLAALHACLDDAQENSPLPEEPSAGPALHELLVRLRLG
jgi:predicted nucleotidyltransferase